MVAEGFCVIIWTIYFYWISRNAFYFLYFTIGLNVIGVVATLYVVESPRYLFGMENFDECRQVLVTIAYRNGITDYEPPVFEDENFALVECIDDGELINPSGTLRPSEGDKQFDHLIGPNQVTDEIVREKSRKTRYLTNTRTTQALNKRESVANMHERVTGIR